MVIKLIKLTENSIESQLDFFSKGHDNVHIYLNIIFIL